MAVGANTYGTVARVQARIGDLVEGRQFSSTTVPATAQVETILDDVAAEINAMLKMRGYTVPVAATDAEALAWLRAANSAEAAARIITQWFPEVALDPENPQVFASRPRSLHAEFQRLMKAIERGAFPAARSVTSLVAKAYAGSQEDSDGNKKLPVFTRSVDDYPGMWGLTEE